MEQVRQIIRNALADAKFPAVLWSGGKDSMLLLTLVREIRPDVPVIWFRAGNEAFAKRMILEWDLDVWSWQPSDVYVLPNGNGLSLVREQAFGDHRFPLVLDIEKDERCIGEFLPDRTPNLFPHFDALFTGYKDSDVHATLGGSGFCPENGWILGKAKTFAPLRHLSDDRVWTSIREMRIPYDEDRYDRGGVDPDSIQACTRCLQGGKVFCPKEQKEIDSIEWEPEERLREFQIRFGFREAA